MRRLVGLLWYSRLMLVGLMLVGACSTLNQSERQPASARSVSYVDPRYAQVRDALNEAMSFRTKAVAFAEELGLNRENVKLGAIGRERGDRLRAAAARYLEIRRPLFDLGSKEGIAFEGSNQVKMVTDQPTQVEEKSEWDPFTETKRKRITSVNPIDDDGIKTVFSYQMALAASLMLMDNYLMAVLPYTENEKLSYILNYDLDADGAGKKMQLQAIVDSYANIVHRQQIAKAIEFIDQVMQWRTQNGIEVSAEENRLYEISQASIWYLMVKNGEAGTGIWNQLAGAWKRLTVKGDRGLRVVTFAASMGFGNFVGLAESRKGYLYTMPEAEQRQLISELKPLDVLMEKTPFRLTDRFIPGHYGHVAIWIGTENQLKDLGVWNDIKPELQEKIRSGHYIVEALRPGVQINTLQHFLNIDDFLAIRDHRSVSDDYRRRLVKRTLAQVGKDYDFNFDVDSHTRIVCSEIAYVVYDDVDFKLDKAAGRYTISPDAVVGKATGSDRPFDPVVMYYRGKRIPTIQPGALDLLLKATDQSYAEFERIHQFNSL